MRVLLTNHLPWHGSSSGAHAFELAQGLVRAGHEVHALVVDRQATGDEPFVVRRIECRAGDATADLPFDIPGFTADSSNRLTFDALTDAQLADYRDENRRLLDLEVEAFDPQIIHAQHIWIQGHLALETGVPYVVSAALDELEAYRRDARFRPLAQQAAENAGRILVESEAVRVEVTKTFGEVADRVEVVPHSAQWIERIVAIYEKVLAARFGEV